MIYYTKHARNLLLLLFPVFFSFSLETDRFPIKITRVKDGDTVVGIRQDNTQITIRLEGIDAPEIKQAYGFQSKQFLDSLILSKDITYKQTGFDRYNRTLAILYLPNGKSVNQLMVENGLAWHFKKYSADTLLSNAEIDARSKHINIWSELNPIAPWDYRKLKKVHKI